MYRQVRASYDEKTITVYQAYSAEIAIPAVSTQRLDASQKFKLDRMTWIKPSWCWMMYRCDYSYKEYRQAHVLALRIPHQYFLKLLSTAILTSDASDVGKYRNRVRVQWDPERNARLDRLEYRSIQIGIPRNLLEEWISTGIVEIQDVTEKARALKRFVSERNEVSLHELTERGLVPAESVYELPDEIAKVVGASIDT